ncbi:unnamed protein product [Nesidiocoris tenuis]|uniref:Uncharacterized protein n=1 Tax=Nesidiocoris tenuis TaxID=355587 RepID=A0A6H5GP27_9HEMI|nr:unnamed protein product [Nesidiocoris tenuis]
MLNSDPTKELCDTFPRFSYVLNGSSCDFTRPSRLPEILIRNHRNDNVRVRSHINVHNILMHRPQDAVSERSSVPQLLRERLSGRFHSSESQKNNLPPAELGNTSSSKCANRNVNTRSIGFFGLLELCQDQDGQHCAVPEGPQVLNKNHGRRPPARYTYPSAVGQDPRLSQWRTGRSFTMNICQMPRAIVCFYNAAILETKFSNIPTPNAAPRRRPPKPFPDAVPVRRPPSAVPERRPPSAVPRPPSLYGVPVHREHFFTHTARDFFCNFQEKSTLFPGSPNTSTKPIGRFV